MQAATTSAAPAMAEVGTVHAAFAATAAARPRAPFLRVLDSVAARYGMSAGDLSYGEAAVRVDRLCAAFAAAGYGHGHRVALLLENRPGFFLAWLALNALGCSVVPVNADLRAAELEYLLGHAEPELAVSIASHASRLRDAATASGAGTPVVDAAALELVALGAPMLQPFPPARRAPPTDAAPGPDTECGLLYTSGTTGRPKGCVLPNEYYLLAGRWYADIGGLAALRPGEDVLVTPLPMVHMNAMAYSTMAMIVTGGCIVPLDRFHPSQWWSDVRAAGATIVHYLGVMPAMLLAAEPAAADREHAVRFGFGAGVDPRQHAAFETRFGFPLLEAWAMTETGAGAVVIAHREPRKIGTACFGAPLPQVETRIVRDDGTDAGEDAPGELWVRAAGAEPRRGFFREYLKDPEATAEAWVGGWFHTGDLVRRDADGQLHFVDRKKNVIRRSGENIAAVEVESVLRRHPDVRDVAVAATPDPVRGDEVLACVVLRDAASDAPGVAASERVAFEDVAVRRERVAGELVAMSLEQLAYYKAPGWVAFLDALPLTASQKVSRGELRALAQRLPGQPGCLDRRHLKKRPGHGG